jgi:hypothetical protein
MLKVGEKCFGRVEKQRNISHCVSTDWRDSFSALPTFAGLDLAKEQKKEVDSAKLSVTACGNRYKNSSA